MGYLLPGGGGRGGGRRWWYMAVGVILCGWALTRLPQAGVEPARWTPPARTEAVPAGASAPAAVHVRLRYRNEDGVWRSRDTSPLLVTALTSGAWRSALAGFSAHVRGDGIELREDPGPGDAPFYLGLADGEVAIWAGRPDGPRALVETTHVLAGTLSNGALARLRAGVRAVSVAAAWQGLQELQT